LIAPEGDCRLRPVLMPRCATVTQTAWGRVVAVLLLTAVLGGCKAVKHDERPARQEVESSAPYQAEVDEGLGAAVAILVDTSGSMKERAPGDSRPKHVVAREAIEAMLDATDAFVARRPDFPVKIGVYSFSSGVRTLRSIQPYDRAAVKAALANLPGPGGGTAIGDALREARPDLYRAGVFRKYLVVVTDGENTNGRNPESVAREIWSKSQGGVQVYFVAFDTAPEKFGFLKDVGGDVIGANTGAELKTALDGLYQGKILAEAADAERPPARK
jgi:Mg-chelatase subunit ChlD